MGKHDKLDRIERECTTIREENRLLLRDFESWLQAKGLGDKTIATHRDNIAFYINEATDQTGVARVDCNRRPLRRSGHRYRELLGVVTSRLLIVRLVMRRLRSRDSRSVPLVGRSRNAVDPQEVAREN